MSKVVVFGSLNMDLSIEAERMPAAGETLSGCGFVVNPGGKGANQAAAAARMGAPTLMLGAVGADAFGGRLVSSLERMGVDCSHVRRLSGVNTGVASITRVAGDNRIILDPGANHALSAADATAMLDELAEPGDVFLAQLECRVDAVCAALHHARALGLYTVLNPAPACALPADVWHDVDMLCLNESECELVCGIMPDDSARVDAALASLHGKGVDAVALTLGARGSVVSECGWTIRSVPPNVDAIDTTCAGDTYLGALVACHAQGMELADAVEWATCASALTTTKVGAQQAIPAREEVAALVERHR